MKLLVRVLIEASYHAFQQVFIQRSTFQFPLRFCASRLEWKKLTKQSFHIQKKIWLSV